MSKISAKYQSVLISILLISVTFGTFWPVLKHEFVKYDDDKYVTENPHITGGITPQSVVWAFTRHHSYMWHPLTTLSHLLDYQLFGLNPFGHHLTSLLLHITNVLLLFWVLKRLTGLVWPSAFVAVIFAVHPLQVESVAWVSERKNVLSALFWILTIAAYTRYAERPGISRYLLVVLTFSLGLMAKPVVVTLPCVLLVLDYWPLQRLQLHSQSVSGNKRQTERAKTVRQQLPFRRLFAEKIPLFILTAIVSAITYIAQQGGGVLPGLESIPFRYRVANAAISYATYIQKLIWPSGLAVFYPHPGGDFSVVRLVISAVLLAAISACCIYFLRSRKYLATGWLLFIGPLIPVIGIVQAGAQERADRYMYIPMVGLLIMVAWEVSNLAAKRRYVGVMSALLTVAIVSAAIVCTSLQLRHWQNSMTLFTHTLSVTRNNFVMHNNYANLLMDMDRVDEAIEQYSRCLQLKTDSSVLHNNLGNALAAKGRTDEAIVHFEKAIELVGNRKSGQESLLVLADAHYNLANALRIQKRFDQALGHYNEALKLKPTDLDTLRGFGLTLAELKKFDEAIIYYNRMLELEPDNVTAHGLLGLALAGKGKTDEAIKEFQFVLSQRPNDVEMHCNIGILLEQQGKTDEAISHYRRALEVDPAFNRAKHLLDAALAKQNN